MCVSVWVHVMDWGVSVGPSSSPGPEQPRPTPESHMRPTASRGPLSTTCGAPGKGASGEDCGGLPVCSSASWL